MNDIKVLILGLVLLVCIIIGTALGLSYASCSNTWNGSFPYKWGVTTDCLIQVKGQWIPAGQYVVNAPTK